MYRLFKSLHPHLLPPMTRQSYRHELVTALTYPASLAMIEGGVVGVLSAKLFHVSPMLFAAIIASANFAHLTSFIWARLSRGRPKIKLITILQIVMLLCVGAIGFLPTDGPGPVLLAGLVILARCVQTGIITLRSTVWRQNYPAHLRAQITGRLALSNSIIIAIVPMIAGDLLDRNPESFRFIFPATMLISAIGVLAYTRIRLRGERELIKYEIRPEAIPQPHGESRAIYEYDPKASRPNFWTVLRKDKLFRSYMLWQFVNGTAAMMGDAVLVYLIAELTLGMANEFKISNFLTTTLPLILAVITMPIWARYLDRVHIVEFRARHGAVWVFTQMGNWLGAMFHSLPIIAVSRVFNGVARGGGMLAWNLGHNDFADRRMVALYMGIHVTLTGIRGAFAPFLALILFTGRVDFSPWFAVELPWFKMGYHVFLVTTALSLMAEIGFIRLGRTMGDSAKKR